MKTARWLVLALGFAAINCSADQDLASDAYQHVESRATHVEVLLTDPFCDVCTPQDKEVLKARSVIVQRVVELIDAAQRSVDVAQFTFSVREIADALLRAHQRGVTVRLAMDAGQDQPGTRSSELRDAGVEVRFITGKPAGDHNGLQHAKFVVVDGGTLLTGSNNFSSTGTTINEENTIVVHDSPSHPVVKGFRCHFEAIWAANHGGAASCNNSVVSFSPSSSPRKMIRDRIRAAERSVDVIMHHFSFTDLVKELRKAAERGVRVRVLLNEATREEHQSAHWTALLNAGGQLRYKRNNADAYQLLHHKLAIIDSKVLVNGSGNWSGSAFFNNFENYVVWQRPDVLQPFRGMFQRLWTWSLSAESLDLGRDAADQHRLAQHTYFGNLHAHFQAMQGQRLLDDGKAELLDADGQPQPVAAGATVREAATLAYQHARDVGGLDFMALSPHCRDDVAGETDGNMTPQGFAEMMQAASDGSDGGFLALAGMEWSTNSVGNHIGIIGTSAAAKIERGRFDAMYDGWLPDRAWAGDRPLVMLNHPKTFRSQEVSLAGSWDMIFGVNLLDIPKTGDRNKKFNDFGLDDYAPLASVRQAWIDGEAMPEPAVVDETWRNLWASAAPFVRLMEVTLNRGKEFGSLTAQNPSLVSSQDDPAVIERRTKIHTDFDYFLTRGFRIAPAASHDNHWANWGSGHTSRTAVIAPRLTASDLYDAVEQRSVYASEDQNLVLGFYVDGRIPMGGVTMTTAAQLPARVWLADPDYAGPFTVRIMSGSVGVDGVDVAIEKVSPDGGWVELTLDSSAIGQHFYYVEVLETGADRMAWSAPIWVERI